ncbi:PRKR-interacting protein 1 homolog [Thrips palmi]|uniref:PRKR-interacting protein 1 homolog n=1 Tax=Thrips palmi TaxID=161013 RepID=A0A6P8ZH72_THRPL|nr:PRKR-interacting protein 1 homolog [Thrips palmi]
MSLAKEKPKKRGADDEKPVIVKNTADLQRLKIEKLMKNPDKPVVIPERPKERNTPHVPEFVRNVMGSSAGAGSGEFHVYRHLRRKEYARQKFIQEKAEKDTLQDEYHRKIEENKKKAEEETAKKRLKRLKKKKNKKFKRAKTDVKSESESEEEDEDNDVEAPKDNREETSSKDNSSDLKLNDKLSDYVERLEDSVTNTGSKEEGAGS